MTYTISGRIEEVDSTTLRITELPVRRWTQDYKEFLESLVTGNEKTKDPFIKVSFFGYFKRKFDPHVEAYSSFNRIIGSTATIDR